MNIKSIPTAEMLRDLQEAKEDIVMCEVAKLQGKTHYSGGLVQDRIDKNRQVVSVILAELARRGGDV